MPHLSAPPRWFQRNSSRGPCDIDIATHAHNPEKGGEQPASVGSVRNSFSKVQIATWNCKPHLRSVTTRNHGITTGYVSAPFHMPQPCSRSKVPGYRCAPVRRRRCQDIRNLTCTRRAVVPPAPPRHLQREIRAGMTDPVLIASPSCFCAWPALRALRRPLHPGAPRSAGAHSPRQSRSGERA